MLDQLTHPALAVLQREHIGPLTQLLPLGLAPPCQQQPFLISGFKGFISGILINCV